jgi:polysaccharide pyruvyl transferase WcaK-like protein
MMDNSVRSFKSYLEMLDHQDFIDAESTKSALLITPSASGSFGDEAMMTATIETLERQGFSRFGIVYPGTSSNWSRIPKVTDIIGIDIVYSYEGNPNPLLRGRFKDLCTYAQLAKIYGHVFCVGADVLDGFYCEDITLALLQFVQIAFDVGSRVRVLGFSTNESPTEKSIQALELLPDAIQLLCRDPLSQQRLQTQLKRSTKLVADTAFLLAPTASTSTVVSEQIIWLEQQKQLGHLIIGFNTSSVFLSGFSNLTPSQMVDTYKKIIESIIASRTNVSFLLIPHDHRGEYSDVKLSNMLLSSLPDAMHSHIKMTLSENTASEIKALCGHLDLVVTGRMHLAIAALGQGVPAIGITYQGKFEGLYAHFELENLTISPNAAFQSNNLAQLILATIPRLETLRAQIQKNLSTVMSLASINFDML